MVAAYDAERFAALPLTRKSRRSIATPAATRRWRRSCEPNPGRLERIGFQLPEQVRYNERTAGERVNGRLKDEFGGRHVRVRGAPKVMCHCMFGILALTVDQLMRLVT